MNESNRKMEERFAKNKCVLLTKNEGARASFPKIADDTGIFAIRLMASTHSYLFQKKLHWYCIGINAEAGLVSTKFLKESDRSIIY